MNFDTTTDFGTTSLGVSNPVGLGFSITTSQQAQGLPTAIPRDELFFWTRQWQEGEAESAAARAAGDVVEFANGREVVRWLFSD